MNEDKIDQFKCTSCKSENVRIYWQISKILCNECDDTWNYNDKENDGS